MVINMLLKSKGQFVFLQHCFLLITHILPQLFSGNNHTLFKFLVSALLPYYYQPVIENAARIQFKFKYN